VLLAINVIWLVATLVAPRHPIRADEAYAECRAAIRKARPEAARIPFPTGDLIRVTRRDSVHHTVRGYFVAPPNTHQTRYVCELSAVPGTTKWTVDSLMVES